MNPVKDLKPPCQKCMDKSFDPYFDILMNWASHFGKPQKFTRILSLILVIFGKDNLYFTRP